jgi:hypothetical protein
LKIMYNSGQRKSQCLIRFESFKFTWNCFQMNSDCRRDWIFGWIILVFYTLTKMKKQIII